MGTISKPNNFSANTTISSSAVNANFDEIYDEFNGNISAANLAADAVTTAKIADDAVTGAKIADATVTSANLAIQAWQSWTPTLVNLSGGTLNFAKYIQIGKSVFFRFKYTLAGAGVAGSVTFTLPVAASSDYSNHEIEIGQVQYVDAETQLYRGTAIALLSTTVANLRTVAVAGANVVNATSLSSTVPFTWGASDTINIQGFYEAA